MITQALEIMFKAQETNKINGQAEYPLNHGNAMYFVELEGCDPLWTAKTMPGYHKRLLQIRINSLALSESFSKNDLNMQLIWNLI